MALTALAINRLKARPSLYRKADSGGLCIEVTPAGRKLWRWRYNFNGKSQMLALGVFPDVSLEQARRQRDEARQLLKAGKHPTREKKAAKLRRIAADANTFESTARTWLELKKKGLNGKYHKQLLARMEQHIFPEIGALPLTEITIPDIVRVVERLGKRGTIETARRMKQAVGQVFRYASQRGLCQFNPASDMRDLLPSTEEKHHACVSPRELPTLLNDIEAYQGDALTRAAIKLLALTFVRTGELIGAKWSEVDFARAEWRVPKERMKMRRPHLVPLSTQALAVFEELHKLTGEKDHVFHSQRGKGEHISNGAVLMALRRMGYRGRMTGHGFRSLASTLLNEGRNHHPDVIEKQLAHADRNEIRAAYNHAEYLLERKKMMQDYADLLDKMRKNDNRVAVFKKSAQGAR